MINFYVLCCSPGKDSVGGLGFIVLSLGPEMRISVGVWWESARGLCLGGASGPGLDRVQTEDCPLCNCLRVCIWISHLWWTLRYKIFISCRLGFGVWVDWPGGFPRLCLVLCRAGYFCMLLAMVCANLLQCLSCVLI